MHPEWLAGKTLVLAGPGRAGRAFARSWRAAGGRIAAVVTRSEAAAGDPALSGASLVSWTEGAALPDSDVIALAVSDDAIADAAARLAPRSRARLAYHFSGALSSALLSPFASGPGRASVASLHPVRPFTGSTDEDWSGAFVAVEGQEDASGEGEEILRALGARPYRIAAENRTVPADFDSSCEAAAVRDAAPPMWKVRIVSCVPGSPID